MQVTMTPLQYPLPGLPFGKLQTPHSGLLADPRGDPSPSGDAASVIPGLFSIFFC